MRILFFANTDWYLYNFRLHLAQSLQEQGHQVVLLSPPGPYVNQLQSFGFRWVKFDIARRGLNPLVEGITILRLLSLYKRERPDIVHHFTVKCVLYGSLVSHLIGIKSVINSVTGLGYVFSSEENKTNWLRWLVIQLYHLALKGTKVIFQNPDDQKMFIEQGLVSEKSSIIIRGSGVDIEHFSPTPENAGIPIVLFPGRLLWDKGVGEFVTAAEILLEEGITARFVLVGDCDPDNPSSISPEQVQEWMQKGDIEWWGWRDDMKSVYSQAHLVCLPSYYKEGLPKALIEAASSGRPIITTDMPGCREIVREGENGILVPPRNANALANAIRFLLENPSWRQKMGTLGREIAKREFSKDFIVYQTMTVYDSLL